MMPARADEGGGSERLPWAFAPGDSFKEALRSAARSSEVGPRSRPWSPGHTRERGGAGKSSGRQGGQSRGKGEGSGRWQDQWSSRGARILWTACFFGSEGEHRTARHRGGPRLGAGGHSRSADATGGVLDEDNGIEPHAQLPAPLLAFESRFRGELHARSYGGGHVRAAKQCGDRGEKDASHMGLQGPTVQAGPGKGAHQVPFNAEPASFLKVSMPRGWMGRNWRAGRCGERAPRGRARVFGGRGRGSSGPRRPRPTHPGSRTF